MVSCEDVGLKLELPVFRLRLICSPETYIDLMLVWFPT